MNGAARAAYFFGPRGSTESGKQFNTTFPALARCTCSSSLVSV